MHKKPKVRGEKGSIVKMEKPIHISNVMLFDSDKKKGTRVRFEHSKDTKERISVSSGKKI